MKITIEVEAMPKAKLDRVKRQIRLVVDSIDPNEADTGQQGLLAVDAEEKRSQFPALLRTAVGKRLGRRW